ncbi:MAG: tRNA (adenosine(37)-N6)-dimethylallyltransferase MiaA [Atribacterota bacterium]|nr:tRNA (adenosine(37)-N6)-dimethylallyltransferase MiaA [Atribacterota bacterium]
MLNNNLFILTGPTGSGKTNISIEIFQYIPEVEIVSADSMQIYKEMNIGTDKPSLDILTKVPHHCIDIVEPDVDFNVAQYAQTALKEIENILISNKKPFIVGGTGLYIKSFIKPLFLGPGRDYNIRQQLEKILQDKGNDFLFEQLKKFDYKYSLKINPNDLKRLIRALEVFHLTGKPFSSFHNKEEIYTKYKYSIICLSMDRNKLYERINQRVDLMIRDGLIEETNYILKKYNCEHSNSMQGLGYKQISLFLKGKIKKEEAVEKIKKETRNFAKRQISWFKNQIPVDHYIDVDDFENNSQCAKYIAKIMLERGCNNC